MNNTAQTHQSYMIPPDMEAPQCPELLQMILTHSPSAIYVQRNRRFIFASRKMLEMFNARDLNSLNEMDIYEHIHPDDREDILESMARKQQGLETQSSLNFRMLGRNHGDIRWFSEQSHHIVIQGQDAIMGFLMDITGELHIIDDLNLELSLLDRMKLDLLSNVSHELRTPLVSVFGYTDLILDERLGPLTALQKNSLKVCRRNIVRLIKLINSLLAFTRLEYGKEKLELSSIPFAHMLEEVLQELQVKAEEKKLIINKPETDADTELCCDRQKIVMVLTELVDNAIKFNKVGGNIDLRTRLDNGKLIFTVTDSGIGIPPDKQDRIFRHFYQAEAQADRNFEGMGIGLSIVVKIVKLHGGNVTVQSTEGHGAEFRVTLPLMPNGASEGSPDKHKDSGPEGSDLA